MIYLYSPNTNILSKLLKEVPLNKRHLFSLIEDKNHLFRVACQSTVITSKEDLIEPLYNLGANHVFVGEGFWPELEPLIDNRELLPDFLSFSNIVAKEECLKSNLEQILKNMTYPRLPICLRGESGTGKTYLAEKLHSFTNPKAPFISKNLSEVSPTLLESELFGHTKGAFTGAHSDKKGLLQRVDGGTLFLDEIATLSLEQQAKLLKVIEEKKFSPVGSNKVTKVEFQLITATCEDLETLIKEKKFRLDFYNRIMGIQMEMPALKNQIELIPDILKSLQKSSSRRLHFTPQCLEELMSYSWPGNLRELKTWLKKASLGHRSVIDKSNLVSPSSSKASNTSLADIPLKDFNYDHDLGLPGIIQRIENDLFDKSYRKCKGRPNKICEDLMISKSVFYRLLKEHPSSRLERIS